MEQSGRRLHGAEEFPWSRPTQSTLHPADPTLVGDGTLQQVSSNKKICVACSIETWEKARRASGKTYKLSTEEQNKSSSYLRCKNCGSHLCNLCAQLFCSKIESMCKEDNDHQEVSPWCRIVRQFLVQSTIEQTGYVQEIDSEFCFSCQHKQSTAQVKSTSAGGVPKASPKVIKNGLFELSKTVRKARQKRRRHQDKYSLKKTKYTPQSSLDGSLYFPFIGILVKSDVNHFDTLSMADQVRYACENGVQHMNITPNNAFYLEQEGFIPEGPAEEIEILHQDFDTSYASPVNPDITIKQKCEVIVIDSIKATILCGATKKTGSNWIDGSEIQKAVEYMSATHVSSAMARNVDLIAIFATPIIFLFIHNHRLCHSVARRHTQGASLSTTQGFLGE
jgi:hypothetical protein